MKTIRIAILVAMALAAAVLARPAGADATRRAAPTSLHTAARPAHTAAAGSLASASHGARHHLRRHAPRPGHGFTIATTRPLPVRPTRSHPDHRAALPRARAVQRDHGGVRSGHRMLATLPGIPSLLTLTVAPLDPDQNETFSREEGTVFAARGPPSAPSHTSLPPSFAGGPSSDPASPAILPVQSGSPGAEPSRGIPSAATRPRPACSYRITRFQEPLQGSSHACRPEGAAVCCIRPSVGGHS